MPTLAELLLALITAQPLSKAEKKEVALHASFASSAWFGRRLALRYN